MPKINSKLPNLQTSIFTIMSRLAKEHDAVNLSQGFPNFDTDRKLIDLVSKAMNSGYNQYAPMQGIYSLREVIAEKFESLYGATYNPETEITVTAGATQAIFSIISAFVHPKDEVIILKPAYDCYEPAIIVNRGVPIAIQMQGKDFKVDWEEFKQAITDKTKMVIINTPHNPSGTIFSKDDMLRLQEILKDTNILLLSDEVYEHIVFGGCQHQSVARFPELANRSFICASFGKTFHITGWKMGYCVAPAELMHEFRKVHQFAVFCVDHPVQRALAKYLQNENHYLDLNDFYQEKRDFFLSRMKDSRFKFTPSEGTYFQLVDYTDITKEGDEDLSKRLIIDHKLASIAISSFNVNNRDDKVLRFCFAKKKETLEKATEILCSL